MKSLTYDWSLRTYVKRARSEQAREIAKKLCDLLEPNYGRIVEGTEVAVAAALRIIAGLANDFPYELDTYVRDEHWDKNIWEYVVDSRLLGLHVFGVSHDNEKLAEWRECCKELEALVNADMKSVADARRELSYYFEHGVLITDPCYLSKGDQDWRDTFDKGIYAGTIYGDWGCTVFSKEGHAPLGMFCADGGLVCAVEPVPEVLKQAVKLGSWCWTLLPNFKGTVTIIHENGVCWLEGEDEGNMSFVTKQTSA